MKNLNNAKINKKTKKIQNNNFKNKKTMLAAILKAKDNIKIF
jgi:hypothetical protein